MLFIVLLHGLIGLAMSSALIFAPAQYYEFAAMPAELLGVPALAPPKAPEDQIYPLLVAMGLFVYALTHVLQGLFSSSASTQRLFLITELAGCGLMCYFAFGLGFTAALPNALILGTFAILALVTMPSSSAGKSKRK